MQRITEITRGYATAADRARAVAQLRRRGYDHFVEYRDTAAKFALCFARTDTPQQPSEHPTFAFPEGRS